MRGNSLAIGLSFMSLIAAANVERETVIYGTDNRADVPIAQNKQLRAIAPAVAGRLRKTETEVVGGLYQLPSETLHSSMGVCTSERFSTQRTAVECTGFLIAPDVLVTAGHCMVNDNDCNDHYWIFDFLYTTRALAPDQVFECKKIIAREQSSKNDFAMIQLNKVALGRTPLKVRRSGSIAQSDVVAVIGHPSGLPLKIDDNGSVRNVNATKNYFTAELDTYGGNSGSPVINQNSLEVEGILVRGENDYVMDTAKNCYKSNVCAPGTCRGEDAQKITALPLSKVL